MQIALEENDESSSADILDGLGFSSYSEYQAAMGRISARIDRTKAKMNASQSGAGQVSWNFFFHDYIVQGLSVNFLFVLMSGTEI